MFKMRSSTDQDVKHPELTIPLVSIACFFFDEILDAAAIIVGGFPWSALERMPVHTERRSSTKPH